MKHLAFLVCAALGSVPVDVSKTPEADWAALGCADGTASEAAGEALGEVTGDGDATGAGSSAPAKTDFAPVITGNPSVNANSMYATAAPIVILARMV